MIMEMQRELVFHPDMELIIRDAGRDSRKQIQDIRSLVDLGIDLLIVSPNESEPLTETVSEVFKSGIPVILIDRKIETADYTAFIGANNYNIGSAAGRYAAQLLNGTGTILEIWGLKGSSPAIERHKGFFDAISGFEDITIVQSLSGEWEFNTAQAAVKDYLSKGGTANLVFAHNDQMALGANQEWKSLEGKLPFFIGVDGLTGPKGGIQAVLDHKLDATLLYPTGGTQAITLSKSILEGKTFKKENELTTLVINPDNALALEYQAEEMISLHNRIVSSKQVLDEQVAKFYGQRFWLIISVITLLMVIAVTVMITWAFRNKARANTKLESQTREIVRQNNELKRISTELEEATKAKLIFFTNISHEFRTPLTLIMGPLESMLESASLTPDQRNQLEMMLRNARRLLRLINQLMDLRKIDNEKMKLHAGQYDIVSFITDITLAFKSLAQKKNIHFNFNSEAENVMVYFDKDKMDKILFNLLSNAFKFTPVNGYITINLKTIYHSFDTIKVPALELEFRDTGPGIKPEHQDLIFERFYQSEQYETSIFPGTGIGLPLTKGFVELHKGEISVVSHGQAEGTSFFLRFRLGKDHLLPDEITESDIDYSLAEKGVIREAHETEVSITAGFDDKKDIGDEDKPLIMIVEDNPDVSRFILSCLHEEYRILTAANGAEAFEKLYMDEPELIISDVMMPVMDGLEFTRKLKSDIRTCHIPLILLTARSSYDQKIEGLETGADSYIPKPFNEKHLRVRVKALIDTRAGIRKHYQHDPLATFTREQKISQIDAVFLRKCNDIIEKHLTDNDYGVVELSKEIGLSRVHVYRKIKQLTGLSVSEFIRNTRLKKAALILIESGKSISEVAYETGFASPSYFSRCFKELFNIAPTEYIQQKLKI